MKKFDLPLWSDTVFLFSVFFLFLFCLLRRAAGLWGAFAAALAAALAASVLFFLWRRAAHGKRSAGKAQSAQAAKLAFHMAMCSPQENASLIAQCLNIKSENTHARAENGLVRTDTGCWHMLFRFEKINADEIAAIIRTNGKEQNNVSETIVAANDFTDEAKKLATAFGVTLKGADEIYSLIKESGNMPEHLIEPPSPKNGFAEKLRFHVRREAWRGYLFSGAFLLLFSLITVFPVYYIIAGSILLFVAVFIRFFGKKTS